MTALLCPLCSESRFDTLEALQRRLVRAATQSIRCPICDELLLGLDKFTIHLFGHTLPSTELPPKPPPPPCTVNMDDLSFLTSWETPQQDILLEIQPEKKTTETQTNPIQETASNLIIQYQENIEKFISNPDCSKSRDRNHSIDSSPSVDSPPGYLDDMLLSPERTSEDVGQNQSGEIRELSQSMEGLLKPERNQPIFGQFSFHDLQRMNPQLGKEEHYVQVEQREEKYQNEGKSNPKIQIIDFLINQPNFGHYSQQELMVFAERLVPKEESPVFTVETEKGLSEKQPNFIETNYKKGTTVDLQTNFCQLRPTELPTTRLIQPQEPCTRQDAKHQNQTRKQKIVDLLKNQPNFCHFTHDLQIIADKLVPKEDRPQFPYQKDQQIQDQPKFNPHQQQPSPKEASPPEEPKQTATKQKIMELLKSQPSFGHFSQGDLQVLVDRLAPQACQDQEQRFLVQNSDIASPETIEKNDYSCVECGKCFKMRGSLIVHVRVAHGGRGLDLLHEERNYRCALCSKAFKKEQHLTQHMKTHDGKQWQCETCSKYFTTKYFLKKHQRLHTGEMPYCCETCGKTFTFQQSYHKHLLYHSSDKPHECKECGRAFKELSTLHNHQRIHSGEKPFACETCGKCFRQRVSYIVHQRIHTGVLPYQCTACCKKFRYKVSQRSHRCTAQPPGIVVRQPGDLIQRILEQRRLLQCQE